MIVLKRLINITVSIYMVLIIAVMPFYSTDGYGKIGTDKYQFFYGVTTKIGIVFLTLWGIYMLIGLVRILRVKVQKEKYPGREVMQNGNEWLRCKWRETIHPALKKEFSATDVFALIYGVSVLLSYLHSDYREMTAVGSAWNGANGWYMGFTTQMLFLAVYFAVSRFWRANKVLPALWIPVALAVFFLGYCNRFSVYPIEMKYANPSFISTIGNINWYCGYVVTVFFGILYYWWSEREANRWLQGVLTAVCVTGFGTLVTQGSNSGHLTLLVLCVVFFLMSVKNGEKMQRFWLMTAILGGTLAGTALLRAIFEGHFKYKDGVVNFLTYSPVPFFILGIGLGMWKLLNVWNKSNRYPENVFVMIAKAGVIAGLAILILLAILITVNTLVPESLGSLSDIRFFTFNNRWGSSRGATYRAGVQVWLDQDLPGKLIGVGPDCMAMYIQSGGNPELLASVHKLFGGKILTNAHCEWLTVMINMGALGLVGFGGMIISAVTRCIRAGRDNALTTACGVGILAYTVNNMVSFQQAMATATMFLLLGMGEAFMRLPDVPVERDAQLI